VDSRASVAFQAPQDFRAPAAYQERHLPM
jgi:hypothetical protein